MQLLLHESRETPTHVKLGLENTTALRGVGGLGEVEVRLLTHRHG